jgi:hypothetical protein
MNNRFQKLVELESGPYTHAEQLREDVDWRKQEVERAGLGFKLPTLESSVGLLGLPKRQKSKLKKVA